MSLSMRSVSPNQQVLELVELNIEPSKDSCTPVAFDRSSSEIDPGSGILCSTPNFIMVRIATSSVMFVEWCILKSPGSIISCIIFLAFSIMAARLQNPSRPACGSYESTALLSSWTKACSEDLPSADVEDILLLQT